MSMPLVPMVLSGEKTQTRRTGARWLKVKPGDVLAMREAFSDHLTRWQIEKMTEDQETSAGLVFRADQNAEQLELMRKWKVDWTPAVHMPLDLVRVHLHVTRVWQERADDISEEDAIAEGMAGLTVEGLLGLAGGSKIECLRAFRAFKQEYLRVREWETIESDWRVLTEQERFRLVHAVLGGEPDTVVTCIEFKAVRRDV